MKMAEVNLATLPEPESKSDSTTKSTKQDSFASSFYRMEKENINKTKSCRKGIDILIIKKRRKNSVKKEEQVAKK